MHALLAALVFTMTVRLADHERVMVTGLTGSGKSTWVAKNIIAAAPRVLAWSPHAKDYRECTAPLSFAQLAQRPEVLDAQAFRVCVVPTWRRPSDLTRQFAAFYDVASTMSGTVLVVDEVGLLRGEARELLMALASQARHFGEDTPEGGCPMVFVAQRANMVPIGARTQCSQVVSFLQVEPSDVEALRDVIGGKLASRVPRLPRFEFVHWRQADAFDPGHNGEK